MWTGPRLRRAALLGVAGAALVLLPAADAAAQSCAAPAFTRTDTATANGPAFFKTADINGDGKLDIVTANAFGSLTVSILLGTGTGTFGAPSNLAAGSAPLDVAVGDFNRDGRPDLAVANFATAGTVTVLLATGPGTFGAPNSLPVGSFPGGVAVADFNRDGKLDIVASTNTTNLSVLLGSGDGTFAPAASIAAGATSIHVAVGDFNRDGTPDVVAVNRSTNQVSVLLGNADGTFGAPATYAVSVSPQFVAVGDLNNDGIPDLAVATSGGSSYYVAILLGTGSGSFAPASLVSTGGFGAQSVALGDFDGDGQLDLAVPMNGYPYVAILLGTGAGSFGVPSILATGGCPWGAAIGDFNRDGRDDLAVSNSCTNSVSIFKNTLGISCPKASLKAIPTFDVGDAPVAVAQGDFNGDRRADLAVANAAGNDVSVLLGAGPGDFVLGATLPTGPGSQPWAVTVGDFDADGKLDFAVANSTSSSVTVYLGNGAGGFAQPPGSPFAVGTAPVSLDAADFDADGRLDLAVSNNGSASLTILKGDGAGGFSRADIPLAATNLGGLAAGDFNGDGYPDLVVVDYAGARGLVLMNNGGAGFLPPATLAVGSGPQTAVVGDFNGDGRLDFATANWTSNNVSVWLGKAGGGFVSGGSFPVGTQPYTLVVGDFNGDRRLDLATADHGSSTVSVLLGNGAGGFAASPGSPIPLNAYPVFGLAVGELTGDGRADLVATQADNVALLAGDGAGSFAHGGLFAAGSSPVAVAPGDFNRDGKPDLAVSLRTTNVAILSGDGFGSFGAPVIYPLAAEPKRPAVADLNRDGWPDVAVADYGNNAVGLLLSDGSGGFTSSSVPAGTQPSFMVVGDFNRDGFPDLAVTNQSSVTILPGPAFSPGQDVGLTPGEIFTADFDHDGILDLAIADSTGVTVSWGLGDGTFPSGTRLDVGAGANLRRLTAADFNRDGNLDLAVSSGTDTITLFYGNGGTRTFSLPGTVVIGRASNAIAAADMDRDGWPDLVVAVAASTTLLHADEVLVLRNNGTGFDPPARWLARATSFAICLALTDVNRDGTTDVVLPAYLTNQVSVFLNTNCQPRRLAFTSVLSSCDPPGVAFTTQPALQVMDDGGNRIQCDTSPVTASLPAVGNPSGATLGGTTTVAATAGIATFTNLSVNLPGRGYQLDFAWPGTPGARSAPFTEGLDAVITGPGAICPLTVATYLGSSSTPAGPLDDFGWQLDMTPLLPPQVSLTLTGLAVGTHALDLTVRQDGCSAGAGIAIDVQPALAAVNASMVSGAAILCPTCTGGTAGATPVGGGSVSYQWSFGTTSGGPYTTIATATSANYQIHATDLGGPGVYYLVVTATPALAGCGTPQTSGEIVVTVYSQSAGNDVPFLTVTSKTAEDKIEWLNPAASYFGTTVWAKDASGATGCTPITDFPAGPGDGVEVTTQNDGSGGHGWFVRGSLPNDAYTCYAVFVQKNALGTDFSLGRTIAGRPFDTTGPVKWAFATGTAAMAPPSLGGTGVYTVSNDRVLHAMARGAAGGTWPAGWTPTAFGGPVQGRSPVVATPVGAATRVVFASSQDGHVYAVDADAGGTVVPWLWQSPLLGAVPGGVQAAPVGMFTASGGIVDYLFVGTRGDSGPNTFYGLKASDGSVVSIVGGIGIVSGPGTVAYTNNRVYFTSYQGAAGKNIWCFEISAAGLWPCFDGSWPVDAGPGVDIAAAPSLRGNRLYVGTLDGRVQAYDTAGALQWEFAPVPSDGPVRGTVFSDPFTTHLYFATNSTVWGLNDDGPTWSKLWPEVNLGTSLTPAIFTVGGNWIFVGGGDGRLHQLDTTAATPLVPPAAKSVVLGDGLAFAGSPTRDVALNMVYIGTDAGVIYAVQPPLP